MKDLFGVFGFVVAASSTFRFVYGSWPPLQGHFSQWLLADSRARWAIAAGMLAGIVGAVIARAVTPEDWNDRVPEATKCWRRGLAYHEERRTNEAISMYQRAIVLCLDAGRESSAAPAYASLGKVYFDINKLDLAEENTNKALALYAHRSDGREMTAKLRALLDLISERRDTSDSPWTYTDARHPFSLLCPAEWLRQRLVQEFLNTGGRIALSHRTHAATFNISVGPLDRPEWRLPEVRVVAAEDFIRKSEHPIGDIKTQVFVPMSGEENVIIAEYVTQTDIRGTPHRRNNGFLSIMHEGLEYTLRWSAETQLEQQARQIISSFKFGTQAAARARV